MTDRIKVSIADHIAIVTLNRPEKHNAIDFEMFEALAESGSTLAANSSLRAVVLEGAGKNFCAGLDTSIFSAGTSALGPAALAPVPGSPANLFQRAAYVWRELPVPVICAISGIAYGGGLQIALGADIRYARADARLSIMEIKWGIIPDMAITATLGRLMPADQIKELAFTGRVVDGQEARQLGLVTALHDDPSRAARDTAAAIAAMSPDAIRAIKRLFDTAQDLALPDALALEAELQLSVLGKQNQREAVLSNIEGRAPRFVDPEN